MRGRNLDLRSPLNAIAYSPMVCIPRNKPDQLVTINPSATIPIGSNLLDSTTPGVTVIAAPDGLVNTLTNTATFRWGFCPCVREIDGALAEQSSVNMTMRFKGITAWGEYAEETLVVDAARATGIHPETMRPWIHLTEIELISYATATNRTLQIGFLDNVSGSGQGSRISMGCMAHNRTGSTALLAVIDGLETSVPFTVNLAATATRHADVPWGTFSLDAAQYSASINKMARLYLDPQVVEKI